jgi:hypothetical protein
MAKLLISVLQLQTTIINAKKSYCNENINAIPLGFERICGRSGKRLG